MSYELKALIGIQRVLESVPNEHLTVILGQDVRMIPITNKLVGTEPAIFEGGELFHNLSVAAYNFALEASKEGSIAYVEAEYFGGVGYQCAVVWQNEAVVLGPFLAYKLPILEMPINRALRYFGVQKEHHLDEFDALSLGKIRHTGDWVA